MFHNTRVFASIRPQLISFSILILSTTCLVSAAPRADVFSDKTACQGAVFLDDITWLDDHVDLRGNQTYALDLAQEGLLNVEATHLGLQTEQPQLEILDAQCRPLNTAFAIHQGHRAALIPSSETYYLQVTAPESRTTTEYRLQIAFASISQLTSYSSPPVHEDEPTDPWEEGGQAQNLLASGTQDGPVHEDEPTDPWEEGGQAQTLLASGTQDGPVHEDEPTDPWEEGGQAQTLLASGTQDGPVHEDEPTDPWEEGGQAQILLASGTQDGPVHEDEPTDPWEEGGQAQILLASGTQDGPVHEDEPTDPWEEGGQAQILLANGTQDGPVHEDEPTDPWEEGGQAQTLLASGTQDGPVHEDEPTDPWEEGGQAQTLLASGTQDSLGVLAAFAEWRQAQTTSPWLSNPHRMDSVLEAALCPRLSHGDDGDSLGCATEMRLGGRLQADMHHAELEDRDTYTFVLHQRALITVASGGDLDLRGMLYDANGQQLAVDDEGAGYGNFRLEATLDAGRYYLRVDSLDGFTGDYELLSAIAPEAWRVAASR